MTSKELSPVIQYVEDVCAGTDYRALHYVSAGAKNAQISIEHRVTKVEREIVVPIGKNDTPETVMARLVAHTLAEVS